MTIKYVITVNGDKADEEHVEDKLNDLIGDLRINNEIIVAWDILGEDLLD